MFIIVLECSAGMGALEMLHGQTRRLPQRHDLRLGLLGTVLGCDSCIFNDSSAFVNFPRERTRNDLSNRMRMRPWCIELSDHDVHALGFGVSFLLRLCELRAKIMLDGASRRSEFAYSADV